jgi:hypothetical protein
MCRPILVKPDKMFTVECQDSPAFGRGKLKNLVIGDRAVGFPGLDAGEHVLAK